MSDERRKHNRVAVELSVEEIDGSTTYFQRSGNLSVGGIFLESTLPHPGGTAVQLKIELPGDLGEVQVKGEVVADENQSAVGMRVRFVGLGDQPEIRERIEGLVAQLSADDKS